MLDNLFAPIHLVIFLFISAVFIIVPFWQIFRKAGMSGALSILMLFPLVNLIMLYILAFSNWKVIPASQAPGNLR